ncbi:fumarylacetoacetase [Humitalea sp. 24SJ18S-53]|uniref:fumarylacetoacetase n=1 Tax=Humitalea sp. 24SJ18S-53 TaxID=3422307 RepID=UPI003D677808
MMVDATHDPALRSWVASANGHADFPIQNLPLGVVDPAAPRGAVAIGDMVLDLAVAATVLDGAARDAALAGAGATLNPLLALGTEARKALRAGLSAALADGSPHQAALEPHLHSAAAVLPARVGDYTDFYAGIHHATNVGRLFRPDAPLMPNYKYVPIGYHGRASSLLPSGTAIRRPNGQRKPATETEPSFGPSRNLDYELELGVWIGPGNDLGEAIPIAQAADHIAGFCLLNDFSARDIQGWEYQPLGPFLAKSFATTISPWIVTPEALAPFRAPQAPRPAGDPAPMDYLWDDSDQAQGALALTLEVFLMTPGLAAKNLAPQRLSRGTARDLYWTVAQLVAHHTSGGCNLAAGDLFGSGTISGPDPGSQGSLLEITQGGRQPLTLASGESRRFLEDGDEVILAAHAHRDGFVSIGFGPCRAVVLPAR